MSANQIIDDVALQVIHQSTNRIRNRPILQGLWRIDKNSNFCLFVIAIKNCRPYKGISGKTLKRLLSKILK